MTVPLLDTNILLRHIMNDEPVQSPRATAFLERVRRSELSVMSPDTVIFESVFTLQRFYKVSREAIRDALLPIIQMPGVDIPSKDLYPEVFDLYVRTSLSFADAFHAIVAKRRGSGEMVSFDRGLDRVPGIRRIEP